MLTKQAADEFKGIYLRQYGVVLTDADVVGLATNLLNLYRAVYQTSNTNRSTNHDKKDVSK